MPTNQKIYYWAPFIDHVATIRAVYNSVECVNDYSKGKYNARIIDATGEWKNKDLANKNDTNFIKLIKFNFIRKFSSSGFLRSRLKYILIFIFCFFPLKNFLKKEKPEFLIVHLVTSLPIFLNILYNFKTKIILRISGKPKMNILRKIFWKVALKKIFKVTFPTLETLNHFKKLNIANPDKFELLYDPVINTKLINKQKREKILDARIKEGDYYIAIGRLTKQKNFDLLIRGFSNIIKSKRDEKLVIIGDGEELSKLKKIINKYNCHKNIFLIGFKKKCL